MNATFAAGIAKPGRVGFVSQSGALLTAILDWATREDVGFSAIVSLGSMLDVGWGDVIDYLGDDPDTDSIVIYMETIGDARAFLSAAREVALTKPIIVIKPGRTAQAAKAAASHTGSLTGSDDVLDAAFRRAGVLRVDSISELFEVAEILAKQPRPRGPKLSIVTNAGGPGGHRDRRAHRRRRRADAAQPRDDGRAQRRPAGGLEPQQPDRHHRRRPAGAVREGARGGGGRPGVRRAAGDPHPAGDDRPDGDRQGARPPRADRGQAGPRLAGWAAPTWTRGRGSCARPASRPSPTPTPRASCSTTCGATATTCGRCTRRRPCPTAPERGEAREDVDRIVAAVAAEGRTLLTEYESKKVLAAYGIPISDTEVAATPDEAVAAAEEMGYPVVAKLLSRTITHKTDVGGVVLNLRDGDAVREAFDQIRDGRRARRPASSTSRA